MPIVSSIEDLEKLFELCRKQKVESICVDGISAKFTPAAFLQPAGKPPRDQREVAEQAEQEAEREFDEEEPE